MHLIYGSIVGLILVLLFDEPKIGYLVNVIYFTLVYLFLLPKFFYAFRFKTIIYFILCGFGFSLMASGVVYKFENRKSLIEKQRYAKKYISDNDPVVEGLLDKLSHNIAIDNNIKTAYSRNNFQSETIKNIIKTQLLDIYFDRFDIEIISFDKLGNNLDHSSNSLKDYEAVFKNTKYKTQISNLYFKNVSDSLVQNQYVLFNDIYNANNFLGTVMLDLKIKTENYETNYSELISNKTSVENPDIQNYSYAIFDDNNNLKVNSGAFNYNLFFGKKNLKQKNLYLEGIEIRGYNHLAIKGKNLNTIVVSKPIIGIKNTISNFSFLFLLALIGFSLIFLVFILFFGTRNFSMNLSSKIQLYLNAAFLLPLVIIIILTISVVRTTLVTIQNKTFNDNTKNIANTFMLHLKNYSAGKTSREYFENEINELAKNTKVDINYYNNSGKLNYTTRPLIFQYKLVSDYLNPAVYSDIIINKDDEDLVEESLGNLNYKAVYYNLQNKNNENLGVVGVPFFNSKAILDQQLKQVISTILVIFLGMFILLMLLSYIASKELTSPLKLITQKLKRTNLDKLDESIEWKSNDEIGLLTRTFNKMLYKLNESKIALSQTEKQTAWQEMAKQVAHEIKNPLTPMKLSIQQLQRTLPKNDPETKDRIERALNSLNEQIDNISEIANSFSEFAKMPVPRSEVFELVGLCRKTVDLYSQNHNINIAFQTSDKVLFVKSDRLLVSRAVTNIIINGIQSVPPIRKPEINVKISKNDKGNFAIIEISDNGSGIAESIIKKVFIPNFTTKVGGSGLGLAMAKRGIEHSGGNIWFETKEGEGTKFFVDIPIA